MNGFNDKGESHGYWERCDMGRRVGFLENINPDNKLN